MGERTERDVSVPDPGFLTDMAAFGTLTHEIRFMNRFFLSERSTRFVHQIVDHVKHARSVQLRAGHNLYRARRNDLWMGGKCFDLDHMGAPPFSAARNGRLNPSGISYLYLGSDIQTAVAEVRPWRACRCTVAEFTLERDVSVASFSDRAFPDIFKNLKLTPFEAIWGTIVSDLFSTPFDERDDGAYLPIQYITERLKGEGLDGIVYDSALNRHGYNVALFNPTVAKARRRWRVDVKDIAYELEEHEFPTADVSRGT